MMYECVKCGEFKEFNESPNHDPLDICPQCRVNYGWISEDEMQGHFAENFLGMKKTVSDYHNDDDNGF